jgi:hexosaminidase
MNGARDNIIGGAAPGEANTIASRKGAISVEGDKTTGNVTKGNAVDTVTIGNWKKGDTKNEAASLDWDVTPFMSEVKEWGEREPGDDRPGEFVFRFQYTGGAHRLDIEWAELLENGKLISRDTHKGATGNDDVNNEYRFALPKVDPKAIYTLRASILSGGDSYGEIQMSRRPPEKSPGKPAASS